MTDIDDQIFLIPETGTFLPEILGEGKKQLIVAVDKMDYGTDENQTLQKMIQAIKFEFPEDITLIKMDEKHHISISSILPKYNDLIIFGLDPFSLGITVDYVKYEIMHFDQSRMMVCDSISTINKTQAIKAKLWVKLQEMYLS
jgi:hypothetical protein